MFEILTLGATAVAAAWGYMQSRRFVRNKLRYVDAGQRPVTPIVAGSLAAAAGVLLAAFPFITIPMGLIFGASVGLGVFHGARDVKQLPGA